MVSSGIPYSFRHHFRPHGISVGASSTIRVCVHADPSDCGRLALLPSASGAAAASEGTVGTEGAVNVPAPMPGWLRPIANAATGIAEIMRIAASPSGVFCASAVSFVSNGLAVKSIYCVGASPSFRVAGRPPRVGLTPARRCPCFKRGPDRRSSPPSRPSLCQVERIKQEVVIGGYRMYAVLCIINPWIAPVVCPASKGSAMRWLASLSRDCSHG
jgi:hypothetical protein